MSAVKRFVVTYRHALAFLALAVVFGGVIEHQRTVSQTSLEKQVNLVQSQMAWSAYSNTVQACERGNIIRQVVYSNTKQAAATQPNATYSEQLDALRSIPNTDLKTGTVDCLAAVQRPFIEQPPGFVEPDGTSR